MGGIKIYQRGIIRILETFKEETKYGRSYISGEEFKRNVEKVRRIKRKERIHGEDQET